MGKELQTTTKTAPPSSSFHARSPAGKCACGSKPGFDGNCVECRKKMLRLQRRAAGQNAPVTAPPVVREVLSTPGQPLDASTLAAMQSRFGHHFSRVQVTRSAGITRRDSPAESDEHNEREADQVAGDVTRLPAARLAEPTPAPARSYDLSHVRIHTDAQAARSASAVNALAYTAGRDIVFAAGQYAPWTEAGRLLLAHELAHVIQQSSLSFEGGYALRISRKPATAQQPASVAVETALKGDDDDVRDLTKIKAWAELKLSGEVSARLIIHLLDGATGDDDEEAGLEILKKNVAQGVLDDTLIALDDKRRFGQLLDDFDGSEYYQLINLLADKIQLFRNRAIFLDKLIEENRVNKREENAVVNLLINTPQGHRAELLEKKGREQALRKEIDDKGLLTTFERLVAAGNEERAKESFGKPKAFWRGIFDEQAKKCMKAGMEAKEVERLWDQAMTDLTEELAKGLLEYRMSITFMLDTADKPLPEEAGRINKEFKARLDDLLARKKVEFCMELKYDVEFNRGLHAAYGTVWTKAALDVLDKSLEKVIEGLPPGFLSSNLDFVKFLRDKPHEDKPIGGETGGSSVSLIDLSPTTVAHELGHVVHNADQKLLEDFQKLSGWEEVKAEDAEKRGKREPDFAKLINRLVEKKKVNENDDFEPSKVGEAYSDNFFYMFNRYGGGYKRYPVRRPSGADFVSDYAATHPMDDFAETFEKYVLKPQELRQKFVEKYKFLRTRVFIDFVLADRKSDLLEQYNKKFEAGLKPLQDSLAENKAAGFVMDLWTKYYKPLHEQFDKDLDAPLKAAKDAAEKKDISNPLPLGDSKETDPVVKDYLLRLDDLMALAGAGAGRLGKYKPAVKLPSADLSDSLDSVQWLLKRQYSKDIIELLRPQHARILKGERVKADPWPELDALAAKYDKTPALMETYLPFYNKIDAIEHLLIEVKASLVFDDEKALDKIEWTQLKKLPAGNPLRVQLKGFIDDELPKMEKKLDDIRMKIIINIRDGVTLNPKDLADPDKVFQEFKDQIASFAATLK